MPLRDEEITLLAAILLIKSEGAPVGSVIKETLLVWHLTVVVQIYLSSFIPLKCSRAIFP